jgi:hypothetical protein
LYGDPIAGTGWIDGLIHPPGDRRAGLSTGPFTIPPGDTQEVVIATIAAIGLNNLQSITELKSYDLVAQNKYNNFFDISTGIDEEDFGNPIYYELFQNYPNPFNPITSIQYAVSSRQFVSLKVYDILGNEIATLVNEEKQPGTYEVEFSAKGGSASGGNDYNLPSGIYFYQLKAGEYINTKKMILLK